ncbi:MAG TPA: 7-cyano-7-deazaguanine synthase QueC [Nitrospirae bacterium]|nr:7-cyano-7-deazaguanine synthase QueC [Nitrospirota bacterium]HDZ88698.1 7-cyano-7-deazaguanine synthase QueC [Nitrospirota bacterium]
MKHGKKTAVVLLSGGIDSSTALAIAMSEGFDCYALSFDYSQRHKVELESAKRVAEHLGAKKHLVISFNLREIGGSALTSEIDVPKHELKTGSQKSGTTHIRTNHSNPRTRIPVTYVPARNTIFLSFGLGWAEVLNAPDIFIGANVVDYSGYPDCRPEYLRAYEKMANLATKISVEGKIKFRINAPLLHMTKNEIIKKGTELGLDYSLTWSCYDPGVTDSGKAVPCGRCDSCVIRAGGFRDAGITDPLLNR